MAEDPKVEPLPADTLELDGFASKRLKRAREQLMLANVERRIAKCLDLLLGADELPMNPFPPLSKLLRFAASGIIAHSTVPLRVATLLGLLASLGAALLGAFFIVSKLCFGQSWPSGFATLSVLILFGIGLNGLFLGVIGEYLARIYLQLQRRPNTVIRKSVNWHATQSEPAKASG